jgi:hypothetical protein
MTSEVELVRELPVEEAGRPCFVRHPDAGGKCQRPAVVQVCGLNFCDRH